MSGYIKSTMNAVESVLASLTQGPVFAVSVDASFEEAASQCRKLCAAIHEQCQKNNACYRDIEFETQLDFFSSRRMCLDGLDLSTAEDEPLGPRSVKRARVGSLEIHFFLRYRLNTQDIFERPTFSVASATAGEFGKNDSILLPWHC